MTQFSNQGGRPAGWQFWVDRGGTFTDVVSVGPDGNLRALKLLSDAPERYTDAAIEGISRLLASVDAGRIDAVRIGTTVGTNALLERRGARTVLLTSRGLGDALRIGTQQRPRLFALDIRLPSPLYEDVIETDERVGADGTILSPLDETKLEAALRSARARGIESVAIAFLHGYRYPDHEQRAAAIARHAGFDEVSVSHAVSPRIKLIERGRTTVVDAYLSPVVRRYVDRLETRLAALDAEAGLAFMQSNGGLVEGSGFRGHNCILSGPAGGVVGMADSALRAGHANVIGFDMGGTSTDVSLYAGAFERADSTEVAGTSIAVPTMRIHTVAAGGGSILDFRDGRLQVGPASAGARPGPACYGAGGPATLTDANVYLGRIQPDFFPSVFGADGNRPIDPALARDAIDALAKKLPYDQALPPDRLAAGAIAIGVNQMAAAIEHVSIQRGHDPREFALSCFGGAGGQHACLVADALGIATILIDPLAGVLSAYGIGIADLRSILAAAVEAPLNDATLADAVRTAGRLADEAMQDSAGHGRRPAGAARHEARLLLRAGTSDTTIAVDAAADARAVRTAFLAAYRERFGFDPPVEDLFVAAVEVETITSLPRPARPKAPAVAGAAQPLAERRAWIGGGWRDVPVYARESLGAGHSIAGPAILVEENGTTIVETNWGATVGETGALVLTRSAPRHPGSHGGHTGSAPAPGAEQASTYSGPPALVGDASPDRPDPILLEIFNRRFMHVAEQMGAILEQTAESVNIRERLDYSCALFDSGGNLIANAPHVPVHLGSMSDSVKAVLAAFGDIVPGDSFVMNAPYSGGTHLPDITVVTPVFVGSGQTPRFVVASRAHHADVGGLTPGSMPAASRDIAEEGIVLEPLRLVAGGRLLESMLRERLTAGPLPARNVDRNIADLKAQLAANGKGIRELSRLLEFHGIARVEAYTRFVRDNAEQCVRAAIAGLADGSAAVMLDGGERIKVAVRVDRTNRSAVIDFAGTSGPSATNFNAPASIARAVVLYVFRALIDRDIPLNAGCLVPLSILLPEGSLVDPRPPAAVVAGNVETSQCIADALLAALGALAASQGTMNNFTFGDARHQYYETIGGGAGAGPGFEGASAVHSHMTNSRLTDPEVLELRYPIRVVRFAIRSGSGGEGRWRGGDGLVRDIEFLEPMQGSILANRRSTAPFGLAGGASGKAGRNYLVRTSGEMVEYGATAELEFAAGDRFVIETPGGGGFGDPAASRDT